MSAAHESRRLLITGVVQGVGFRYATVREGQRLGLSGWVRNRRDGSVEATISGPADALVEMIAWCRRGPAGARVDHVSVEIDEPASGSFEQRPTI